MTTASTCKEQSCSEKIRADHFLCREHWQKSQEGVINECPQCGTYKDAKYPFCIECNKKSTAKSRSTGKETSKETANPQKARRYDPAKADTFAERTALLDDDQKAKDKRQLFHDQHQKCIYCGNVYRYDELEIEHIIPKALGGPDNIRNCQLACKSCNQTKGTMTDIEFRQKHAGLLPQEERTPADPPIKPELLRAPVHSRPSPEDDQKAKDKRQLFHDQHQKCIYCGNVYRYDELEIEHIIPKALGGPDNIRNCQLACKTCNQAKGTMTDIEFREKHANLLPQKERTPADPPIKPELLQAPAQNRPQFWRYRRK